MNLYRKIEKFLKRLILFFWKSFIKIHEKRNIKKKKHLYRNIVLTNEQKNQIDVFYKNNYGKKIPYDWHRLYQSYTGKFDYRYMPEYIFSTNLELRKNKRLDVLPFENKNLIDVLFTRNEKDVRCPKTIMMCVDGVFFDQERNILTAQQAFDLLYAYKEATYQAVIKVTMDSSSGRGVQVLNLVKGVDTITNKELKEILNQKGDNFVVQEKIIPYETFEKLYPNAINTLRVITYMTKENIKVAPIIMRIGRGGGYVDNAHAGGMIIAVNDDGTLSDKAFTEYQEIFTSHPDTKVVFAGYQLFNVEKIKRVAINLHKNVPMLQFVSWDFTVDNNGEIVLIEANLHSQSIWMPQIAHGKACFGDDTAEILSNCWKV